MPSLLRWSSALPIAILLGVACVPVEALPSTGSVAVLNQPVQAKPAASARPRVQPADPPLSPPVTVRVGMLTQNSDAGLFIANDKGYFREQGIEMESLPFQNAQEMVG